MIALTLVAWALMIGGTLFFVSGAIGLLRFPDIFTRLHAIAKTDTLGLGLLAAGLALLSESWLTAIQLLLIWLLAMASAAINSQLLARYSLEEGSSEPGSSLRGSSEPGSSLRGSSEPRSSLRGSPDAQR